MSPSTGTSAGPTYEQAARSWVEHLTSGGTTPWMAWADSGAGQGTAVPPGWSVPGAARLELLRRLWLEQSPAEETRVVLTELLLSRSAPGRGLAEQPLTWSGLRRDFGAPPVDPATVPDVELLRLGAGALAELVLATAPTAGRSEPRRRLLGRAPAFVLAGAPVTTAVVRRVLAAAGHVEGGHAPTTLLLAEPLDVALGQVWSARVQGGAAVRWRGFVDRWAHRPALPPSVDVLALARRRAARSGAGEVHVVVDPGADAARTAADVLGVRLHDAAAPTFPVPPRVCPLSPAATDVARRVNAVLHVKVPAERLGTVARELSAVLASCDQEASDPLAVPVRFRAWAEDAAARQASGLLADGYPVHGEPGRLVPRLDGRPVRPSQSDAVRVMLRACLAQAATNLQHRKAEPR